MKMPKKIWIDMIPYEYHWHESPTAHPAYVLESELIEALQDIEELEEDIMVLIANQDY